MPSFTFPTVGPLCLSSPPTRYGRSVSRTIGIFRCARHEYLWWTANRPSRSSSFHFSPIPCNLPLRFVSRLSRHVGQAGSVSCPPPWLWFSVSTPHPLTITARRQLALKFPSYPRKYMPRFCSIRNAISFVPLVPYVPLVPLAERPQPIFHTLRGEKFVVRHGTKWSAVSHN